MEQNQVQESQVQIRKDVIADKLVTGSIMILSILLMGASAVIWNMELAQAGKMMLFLVLLNGLLIFYIKSSVMSEKLRGGRLPIVVGYLLSLVFVLAMAWYDIYNLWMLGPLLVAALVDTSLGLLYNLIFVFLLANVAADGIDQVIYRFILCALLVVLAKFLSDWKNMVYVCLIAVSCNVTLLLIMVNFMYKDSLSTDSAGELLSTLLALFCVFLVKRRQKEPEVTVEPVAEAMITEEPVVTLEAAVSQPTEESGQPESETTEKLIVEEKVAEKPAESVDEVDREMLQRILSEDHPLLKQLKEKNPELYRHSMKIGEISYMAAEMIEADAELTRAGGYYHEIGRLVSSNYIKEGIKLAKANGFPKQVIDIIKQHNIKVGQPVTAEAALVMISDSVISSLDFMKESAAGSTENADGAVKTPTSKISPDKLINGIFDARLLGGNLDRSGITLAQYKVLKRFYSNAIAAELEELKR